jgi:signal transduction histidine kinase
MGKINSFLFIQIILFSVSVSSQEKVERESFYIEIDRKTSEFKNEINFKKANFYFSKKNWDSSLVYSMRQINDGKKNIEINDYCHYIRAISFLNKNLFAQAKKELTFISTDFHFFYRVKITYGIIALNQGQFQKALVYFESIENQSNSSYDFIRSEFYHNLGLCYFHTKQYNKAEKYFLKASKLNEIEKDSVRLIRTYINLGNLYYEQYKDAQAIPYFEKAYQLSKKSNNFELKQNAAENMAAVEENRKNFTKALVYRKEMEQWKDSLNDQNKVWAIAQLEKKHAVQQKQKEITLLEAENKIKIAERNGLFYSSLSLLLLLGTSVYFFRQKVKRNKIILAQKDELDELNATKDKLFSIVSHDLRSSVNALKTSNIKLIANLESKNYTELDQLLHTNSSIANSAYNLLDNLLNWALLQTKQLYFHQESQHLFSVIQQIEFNYKPLFLDKKITFSNTVSKYVFVFVDLDSFKIIIRNLLDNAIKFSKPEGEISIYTVDSDDKYCTLVVEDTGIGMSAQIREELLKESVLLSKKGNTEIMGSGLGTHLCKSMITKNGGKLAIESKENIGTKICVSLLKSENNG